MKPESSSEPQVDGVGEQPTQSESSQQSLPSVAAKGAVAGSVAAVTSFPFEGLKKRLQTGQVERNLWAIAKYFTNPREVYRGVTAFIVSLTPTSAIQNSSNVAIQRSMGETTEAKIASGVFGGAMGAIASTAVENTILRQQKLGVGFAGGLKAVAQEGPKGFYRGLSCLAVREAIFGLSYMQLASAAGKSAREQYGPNAVLPATVTVGVLGSLASHPFDTTATAMQEQGGNAKPLETAKRLFEEGGVKRFYRGGAARCGLFTIAMVAQQQTMAALNAADEKKSDQNARKNRL